MIKNSSHLLSSTTTCDTYPLDANDIGAKIAKYHTTEGSRRQAGDFYHLQAFEGHNWAFSWTLRVYFYQKLLFTMCQLTTQPKPPTNFLPNRTCASAVVRGVFSMKLSPRWHQQAFRVSASNARCERHASLHTRASRTVRQTNECGRCQPAGISFVCTGTFLIGLFMNTPHTSISSSLTPE